MQRGTASMVADCPGAGNQTGELPTVPSPTRRAAGVRAVKCWGRGDAAAGKACTCPRSTSTLHGSRPPGPVADLQVFEFRLDVGRWMFVFFCALCALCAPLLRFLLFTRLPLHGVTLRTVPRARLSINSPPQKPVYFPRRRPYAFDSDKLCGRYLDPSELSVSRRQIRFYLLDYDYFRRSHRQPRLLPRSPL